VIVWGVVKKLNPGKFLGGVKLQLDLLSIERQKTFIRFT
jgi:hypothetical protein